MVQHESTEELLKRCAIVLEKVRRVSRKLTSNVQRSLGTLERCPKTPRATPLGDPPSIGNVIGGRAIEGTHF